MDHRDAMRRAWDAFVNNVNWGIPHDLDKERLYEFFSIAHLDGIYVGQPIIDAHFGERDEGDPRYEEYCWLVSEADIAGKLLKTYDKVRSKGSAQ
jgi:hypothetical protein